MRNLIKNKRAAMSPAIVLLVFATLVLIIFALFVFNFKTNKIDQSLSSPRIIEDAYSRAEVLNFYIRQITNKINADSDVEALSQFKAGLSGYKDSLGDYLTSDLIQIDKQITDAPAEHLNLYGKTLQVNFKINILDIPYTPLQEDATKLSVKDIVLGVPNPGKTYRTLYSYDFSYTKIIS